MTNNEQDLAALPEVVIPEMPEETDNKKRLRHPDELYRRALVLLKGEDLPEAFKLLREAARQEHVLAMYELGHCYEQGIGTEPDVLKALNYFDSAAEYGLPEAVVQYPVTYFRAARPLEWSARQNNDSGLTRWRKFTETNSWNGAMENWIAGSLFFRHVTAFMPSHKMHFYSVRDQLRMEYYRNHPSWNIARMEIRTSSFPHDDCSIPELLARNDVPTLLFKGRIAAAQNRWDEARKYFDVAEDEGDLDGAMELALLNARQGRLDQNFFNPANDLRYSDHPLYEILRYAITHPDDPGVQKLLAGKWFEAQAVWETESTAEYSLLHGLIRLYSFYHYGFDFAWYRIEIGDVDDVRKAWQSLDRAVATLPAAEYHAALRRMNHERRLSRYVTENQAGRKMLQNAARRGYVPAQLREIRKLFEEKIPLNLTQWAQLEAMCQTGAAAPWLLKGEILLSRSSSSPRSADAVQALIALENAAQKGEIRGLYLQGLCHYKGIGTAQNRKQAGIFWREYMAKLQLRRWNDFYDLSSYNIHPPVPFVLDTKKHQPIITRLKCTDPVGLVREQERKIFQTY